MQGRGVAGGELYAKSKKTMDQAKASGVVWRDERHYKA